MIMFKIAFFGTKTYYRPYLEPAFAQSGINARFFDLALAPETIFFAKGNDGICVPYTCEISREMAHRLYAMGVKYLFIVGISKSGMQEIEDMIQVIPIGAFSPESVAEYSFALFLAANRQLHRGYIRVRAGNTNRSGLMGRNVAGSTVGIIGMGRVGKCIARIYQVFQANVISYDVTEREDNPAKSVSLEELLEKSDVICIHIPTSEQTYHMINRDTLSRMKKDVILVSTSGEGIIDYYDLLDVLHKKKIGAVAIDYNRHQDDLFEVGGRMDKEELEDVITQISALNNALITCNLSYFTDETMKMIADEFVRRIKELEADAQ